MERKLRNTSALEDFILEIGRCNAEKIDKFIKTYGGVDEAIKILKKVRAFDCKEFSQTVKKFRDRKFLDALFESPPEIEKETVESVPKICDNPPHHDECCDREDHGDGSPT